MKRKASNKRSEGRRSLAAKPRTRLATDAQTAAIKDHFPRGLAQPALRALFAAGFTSLEQLTKVSERQLLDLHGMGPNALKTLRTALVAKGLTFRCD